MAQYHTKIKFVNGRPEVTEFGGTLPPEGLEIALNGDLDSNGVSIMAAVSRAADQEVIVQASGYGNPSWPLPLPERT